jgi:hypothetical protein
VHIEDGEIFKKSLPLKITLAEWKILGKYLVKVNKDRLDRGQQVMGFAGLFETFARLFILHEAASSVRAFDEIVLETYKRAIPGFFSHDELVSIASASGADLFELFSLDRTKRTVRQRAEERRALQGPGRGPQRHAGRPARQPKQVRGQSLQLAPGFDGGAPRVRRSKRS